MSDERQTMKVAAIGDLHVREDEPSAYSELFAEVSSKADVLVLAGDLTDLGKPREAQMLVEDLRSCTIPVVAVLGNHDFECDAVEEVIGILRDGGVRLLDGQTTEIEGVSFVGV